MASRFRSIIQVLGILIFGVLVGVSSLSAADGLEWGGDSFSFTKDLSDDAVIRGFDLPCRSFQIWGDYYIGKGEIEPKGTPEPLSFDNSINGAQLGINLGLGSGMLATAYYNYDKNKLSSDAVPGKRTPFTNDAQTHLGGFGLRYNTQGFFFSLLGTAGLDDYELLSRNGETCLNYDGWQAGGSFETGYFMRTGGMFTLKPFGNLQYNYIKADGIDYTAFRHKDDKFKADALFQTLGARIDAELALVTLQGRFGWVHQYLKSAPINNYQFSRTAGTFTPTQSFFEGSTSSDYFWGGAGVKVSLLGTIAASFDYDVLLNCRHTTHLGSVGLLWNF